MKKNYSNPTRKSMFADDTAAPVPPPKEFGREVYDEPIGPSKKRIFFPRGNPFKVLKKMNEQYKRSIKNRKTVPKSMNMGGVMRGRGGTLK